MRSACLRLRQCRQKGPKCLQVNEFVCQTHQYESVLNWNWKQNEDNAHEFIENTLKLIMMCDENLTLDIAVPQNENDGATFKVYTNQQQKNKKTLTMVDLILEAINQDKRSTMFDGLMNKCLILQFSSPVAINISSEENSQGIKIIYQSHLDINETGKQKAYFRFNNKMFTQEDSDYIYKSSFGIIQNVTMLSVRLCKKNVSILMNNYEEFTYGKQILMKLQKEYLKCKNLQLKPKFTEIRC